ncbi:MAG TPA: ATP-dependent DNA helicase [Micromonosporaceae bacterium]|nr:ATP-dependent DNA helicase [Micromonosporaceae bacterium]
MRRPAAAPPPLPIDEVQRRVVQHDDGPLLVLGGPGTGKTATLVEAVAARVAGGMEPPRILVLAFNRRAAGRLRDAVAARIAAGASPTTAEPLVRTFHAYAFGLLRRAAAELGEPPPRLLTGPEQDVVIRELVTADDDRIGWPEALRAALPTRAFASQLRDLLARAAERGIGAADLAGLGHRLGRPDWAPAARFLDQYVQVLALRDAAAHGSVGYDPAELVRAAIALLTGDPARLAAERERLCMVYVDDLADTDPVQLELLALVAGGGTRLVAFADPDSSTFAFRGADPSAVLAFPDRFHAADGGPAPTVTLLRSYRSTPELVSATRRVARRLRGPLRHRALVAAGPGPWPGPPPGGPGPWPGGPPPGGPPGPVRAEPGLEVRTFRSATSEAAYVAHRLREAHLLDGVPWSRMAVLLRSTVRQLAGVRRALAQADVPTVTHAEDLPLHAQPAVAALLLLLRCALEPDRLDEEAAVALLHSPLGGADPLAERRLRQGLRALALAAGDRRPSGVLLVEALRDPAELAAVERRWAAPARAVAALVATARDAAARPSSTVEDVLWAVWHASGLADRWVTASLRPAGPGTAEERRAEAADRDLDAVVALFDAAARFADRLPGARTEVFLDHVAGQDLPGDSLAPVADRGDAVRILTAHAAKGLEWDVVAVMGVQEGVWPDLRLRGSLLGSEVLVDAAAGRGTVGPGARGQFAASQTAALLDEERRLFYVAATRARRRLLVTAVASGSTGGAEGEEQPSRFLDEIERDHEIERGEIGRGEIGRGEIGRAGTRSDEVVEPAGEDPQTARPATHLPRALTLAALVAELRVAVTDPAAGRARREAAARQLARLAEAGVRGAHPDEWWGLPELSDDRRLAEAGEPVTVTPSGVESALRCALQWLLRRHGGEPPATAQQGIGNLVHAAAMLAHDASVDRAELAGYVAARFDAIELAARWLADRERQRADQMLDKLVGWLAANPRRLVAIEREFLVQLGEGVELKGRVDRLEVDEDGRLVVVDLKTGKSKPTAAEVAAHAQLGAYQAAVEAGAFAEFGTASGGAALVQLGSAARSGTEQRQPPLAEVEDPGWAGAMIRRAAGNMAASTFEAVASSSCRTCPVRTACPVSSKGRQLGAAAHPGRREAGPTPGEQDTSGGPRGGGER